MASDNEPSSAATKVFGTFELVESILLRIFDQESTRDNLETRARTFAAKQGVSSLYGMDKSNIRILSDRQELESIQAATRNIVRAQAEEIKILHRLQRVNPTFRYVLARSKSLRQKTYRSFKDEDDPEISHRCSVWGEPEDLRRLINPLASHFDFLFPVSFYEAGFCTGYKARPENKMLFFHVIADDVFREQAISGSWRDMLLTKKPIKLGVSISVKRTPTRREWHHPADHMISIDMKAEATLGDVADGIAKAVIFVRGEKTDLN